MNKRLLATTCLAALLVGASGHGASAQFDDLYAFGDSLTDTGNMFALSKGAQPPEPFYYQGRSSNGPVWIESFSPLLGLGYQPDTNFAIRGAFTNDFGVFDAFGAGISTGVLGDRQTGKFTSPGDISGDALVVVWAGANDYVFGLLGGLFDPSDTIGTENYISGVVGNLGTAISDLYAAGGRHFLVPNLPNLGDTPDLAAFGDLFNLLTSFHNAGLASAVEGLRVGLPDAEIVLVDVNAAFVEMTTNPTFGFANVTDACLSLSTGEVCSSPDTYLSWDGFHPTAAAHALIGEFMFATLVTAETGPLTISTQADLATLVAKSQAHAVSARLHAARAGESGFSVMGNRLVAAGPMERRLAAMGGDGIGDDLRYGLSETYVGAPAADQRVSYFIYSNDDSGGLSATSGRLGFAYDSSVLAAGIDYRVDDTLLVGVMFGSGESDANLQDGAGGIALGSNAFTVYGSLTSGGWYADATAGMSFDDYGTITRTTGSTLFPVARADTEGTTGFATLDGGYTYEAGASSVGPIAGLRYSRAAIDGYREAGAGPLNMTVGDQIDESMIGSIGLKGATRFESGLGPVVSRLSVAYEHEFQDSDHRVAVRLPGAGSSSLTADPADGDVIRLDAALGIQLDDSITGLVDYNAAFGQAAGDEHAVLARIKIGF